MLYNRDGRLRSEESASTLDMCHDRRSLHRRLLQVASYLTSRSFLSLHLISSDFILSELSAP